MYLSNHFRCAEVCGETAYLAFHAKWLQRCDLTIRNKSPRLLFHATNHRFVVLSNDKKNDQIIKRNGQNFKQNLLQKATGKKNRQERKYQPNPSAPQALENQRFSLDVPIKLFRAFESASLRPLRYISVCNSRCAAHSICDYTQSHAKNQGGAGKFRKIAWEFLRSG